ncbi:glycosyltransferase [Actinomadura madurae]|uniref:glycosyltransferase n=2 Tax=Actinomadura madurae TaxID=1993 RepID=UPI0020D222E2|nr:glycosyltransferase [Actinomadura madurae]MCQ0016651.1 glycosyltransferase [Actinomadura madurae]
MMTVLNGWDADTLPRTAEPPPAARAGERAPRFAYVGTVTDQQPIEALVEGFARARELPGMTDAVLDFYGYFGFFKNTDRRLRKRFAAAADGAGEGDDRVLAPGVHYRGPVSKTALAGVYQDSDVLVFLNGGGRYVTSGKIFEYMAAGRPVVSVHTPGSAAEEVLRDYPLWFNPGGLDPARHRRLDGRGGEGGRGPRRAAGGGGPRLRRPLRAERDPGAARGAAHRPGRPRARRGQVTAMGGGDVGDGDRGDAGAPRVLVLAMDPGLTMDPDPAVSAKRQYARIIGLAATSRRRRGPRSIW